MADSLTLLRAMNGIHEEDVVMAGKLYWENSKPLHRRPGRFAALALAAALLLALGATAWAGWSIHAAEQAALKENLNIVESRVDSYVEYEEAPAQNGLVLLSAVNDGEEERVYLNVYPVTEEEAAAFPDSLRLWWEIGGTDCGGFAAPNLPVELNLSGSEAIREAVLAHAWDRETQTLTVQCYLPVERVRAAADTLGEQAVPLRLFLARGDGDARCFGPIPFALTVEQRRVFDFGSVRYYDRETDREIELLGLELTPFTAVWKLRYDVAADFHRPDADWAAYDPWSRLEDKVGIESKLLFSDGTDFSTGGALSCPIEDGVVMLHCAWGSAIDIDDVQKIVLGDTVLWEIR